MDELEQEKESKTNTEVVNNVEKSETLEDLPRLEDLLKSEQEINEQKQAKELRGLTQVEPEFNQENLTFRRKEDEKKTILKKRAKIVTAVYTTVLALLFILVGVNIVTQAILSKDIRSNTKTIQSQTERIATIETEEELVPTGEGYTISLTTPRDYSDDKKDLTLMDKLTIIFGNLFK